jgi:hypothetical protein
MRNVLLLTAMYTWEQWPLGCEQWNDGLQFIILECITARYNNVFFLIFIDLSSHNYIHHNDTQVIHCVQTQKSEVQIWNRQWYRKYWNNGNGDNETKRRQRMVKLTQLIYKEPNKVKTSKCGNGMDLSSAHAETWLRVRGALNINCFQLKLV